MALTFTETFTRSNRDLNGDNGWLGHNSDGSVTGVGAGRWEIISNKAWPSVSDNGMSRDIGQRQWFPYSLTYTISRNSIGKRYQSNAYIGHSSLATLLTTSINFGIFRSDKGFNNSNISIFDGVTLVAQKLTTYQFDGATPVDMTLTINSDGSGSLVANQGGSIDSATWAARTWTNGIGRYFGFVDINGNDGTGDANLGGIDTISYTYDTRVDYTSTLTDSVTMTASLLKRLGAVKTEVLTMSDVLTTVLAGVLHAPFIEGLRNTLTGGTRRSMNEGSRIDIGDTGVPDDY